MYVATRKYLLVLLALGMLTRVIALEYPDQVVFDEVHFGKFVNSYCCTGEHFFDIHPPHAKLLVAGAARLAGYEGSQKFENIGESFVATAPVFALRLVPAVAGALLPLVFFLLLRQLGASPLLAFFGGWLAVFDNALIVQSRLISLDSVLLLATFGSVSAYLHGSKQQEASRRSWLWFVAAGVLAGLAVGTKLTGLVALGLISSVTAIKLLASRQRLLLTICYVLLLAAAASTYFIGWGIHEQLLTEPGPGDAFYARDATLWTKHQTMLSANYNLTATHPYASHWWSWPLMLRSVFYWQGDNAAIYFLGNPIVWWGSLILALAAIGALVRTVARARSLSTPLWIPLTGFLIAFIPLVRVPRPLFLYHYLTPLLFSLVLGLLWLDGALTPLARRRVVFSLGLAVLAAFVLFSPLTYGYLAPWQEQLFWLPTWR